MINMVNDKMFTVEDLESIRRSQISVLKRIYKANGIRLEVKFAEYPLPRREVERPVIRAKLT